MTELSPLRVDIVSDVVCPWCVIGWRQLARAAEAGGIALDVHWHPFELNPQMAPGGENLRAHLAAKYGTTAEDSAKARARLTEVGAALGFTFDYVDDMRMYNTFRAHQLIDWAEEQGQGAAMNHALMEAFFTRHAAIEQVDVLAEVAAGIGLDAAEAREMLDSGARAEQVRAREAFWIERGIQGVPAMVFDRKHLVTGAQGEEAYGRILAQLTSDG